MVQTGAMLHDVFERDRVRTGLVEAITKLCKNGLNYSTELCVEGLLGITLDNKEVLLVNIKEIIKGKKDDGFYRNSFGSESFSGEASLYDKPLDFSSKIRSSTNDANSGTCQDQRPGRASRKRKPKHISETIILDNDDEEVIIEGATASSISNFHSNAVDFSTKSCKPQVPIATQVKRTQEANSYATRGTPSPIGRGSPRPASISPSSPAISGSKATSTAISHNSSIPQAALVTPAAKKPKLIQGLFRSHVQENGNNSNKDSRQQQQQQQQQNAQATPCQDLSVQDKIGNLIQTAVDSVVGKVHSNLVQSHSASKPTNTDSLQNALETAVRSAHADSYQKPDDAPRGSTTGDGPPSPSEPGRLVIVEPPSGGEEEQDGSANHDENSDLTNNSENNTDSKNGAGKKEDDALSSSSSSRSLQTTPDPCKQQSVSATPITLLRVPLYYSDMPPFSGTHRVVYKKGIPFGVCPRGCAVHNLAYTVQLWGM